MSVSADHVVVGTTATQLPNVPCRRVHLSIKQPGGPAVWLGDSDLTSGANGNGFPLGYGDFVIEAVRNLDEIYAVADVETSIRYFVED